MDPGKGRAGDKTLGGGIKQGGGIKRTVRRLWPWRQELGWAVLGAIGAVSLLLGYIGIHSYLSAQGEPTGFWTVLYNDLQLLVLEPGTREGDLPWQLDVARITLPVVLAAAGVVGATLLLRDDWNLFRARIAKEHVIVCGLGRRGLRFTRALLDRGIRVVVVEADEENKRIRDVQRARGARPRLGVRGVRAGLLTGDATDPDVLRRAGIGRAGRLLAVCDDDGTNVSIAAAARDLAGESGREEPLVCVTHVFDRALSEMMRSARTESPSFRLQVFNTFEDGARAMLIAEPVTRTADPERPHVIVVGLGWLGDPLAVEIARFWREFGLKACGQLSLTLVDSEAEERKESLLLRHPWIEQACNLRAAAVDVGRSEFESGRFLRERGRPGQRRDRPGERMLVYVCLDDTTLAVDAALALRRLGGRGTRVVVRTDTEEGVGALLDRRDADGIGGTVPFSILDRVCDAEAVIGFGPEVTERIAVAIHEAYRAGEPHAPEHEAMQPWEELDDSYRESNRDQARDVGRKLNVVDCELYPLKGDESPLEFTVGEVEVLAPMEHQRFVADRQRNGWTLAPGPSDPKKKTSPYLIPFEDLEREVQDYDRNAVRELPGVLARAGYGIVRKSRVGPR